MLNYSWCKVAADADQCFPLMRFCSSNLNGDETPQWQISSVCTDLCGLKVSKSVAPVTPSVSSAVSCTWDHKALCSVLSVFLVFKKKVNLSTKAEFWACVSSRFNTRVVSDLLCLCELACVAVWWFSFCTGWCWKYFGAMQTEIQVHGRGAVSSLSVH